MHKPTVDRRNLGFLLAKASQRWNELLAASFRDAGYPDVSPAFGSILLPLFEEDGLQIIELGRRARLSKQTMTTMIRLMEQRGLVERRPDPADRRAARIFLTERSRMFRAVAARVLSDMDALVQAHVSAEQLRATREMLGLLQNLER